MNQLPYIPPEVIAANQIMLAKYEEELRLNPPKKQIMMVNERYISQKEHNDLIMIKNSEIEELSERNSILLAKLTRIMMECSIDLKLRSPIGNERV